jgi:signal transduction histidine kinase
MDWEKAFLSQYQDACVGRLLRGILHNLNGVNQAFSLQAALFRSMFLQVEQMLQDAEKACPDAAYDLTPLRELFRKRVVMVSQMEDKVDTSQRIVARVLPLEQLYGIEQGPSVSLAAIVDMELEILSADSFFKHRIKKTVALASDLPPLRQHCLELHTICFVLLDNAAKAMRDSPSPTLSLTAQQTGKTLILDLRDSGPGITPEHASQIFEPFFSTRENALGVGLSLVRKMVTDMGGTIEHSTVSGETCFTVCVPLAEVI